jgi:hypothetical protein
MVRHVISLFLMPLMLANQGPCLAHTHHASLTEPLDHASRPHIHLACHGHNDAVQSHDHAAAHTHDHHADHSHHSAQQPDEGADEWASESPQAGSSAPEHEHDAVYFAVTTPITSKADWNGGRRADDQPFGWMLYVPSPDEDNVFLRLGPRTGLPTALMDADCPIFLRTLSLRL